MRLMNLIVLFVDADRIASKIDRNDENFDFEENHKKTRISIHYV